jgi:mycothiol synthase
VWVAEADAKLVGYGVALEQPSRRCTVYVVVHPSQRRNGLGSQLLDLSLTRAQELGSKTLLIYANERNAASNLFLKHHGFDPVGSSGTMKASDELESHSFDWPAGFTLKKYSDINEPRVLLTALDVCYLGMWGHQHRGEPSEEELRSPRFLNYYQAEDILLLFDHQGAVCGLCSVKSEGKRDENGNKVDLLDAPGVIKKYRQEGYQRGLVIAGIEHLRRHETHLIVLEFWGESEEALAIYRDLGFEMQNHYITYHKELE